MGDLMPDDSQDPHQQDLNHKGKIIIDIKQHDTIRQQCWNKNWFQSTFFFTKYDNIIALSTNSPLCRLKLNMKKKRKQSIGNFYFRPKSFLNIYRFLCIVTSLSIYKISCLLLYLRQFYKGVNTV